MKHVYPPRHPAWLDDRPDQPPPADADASQPVAPRGQVDAGGSDVAGAAQPERRGREDVVDGAAGSARRP